MAENSFVPKVTFKFTYLKKVIYFKGTERVIRRLFQCYYFAIIILNNVFQNLYEFLEK